MATACALRPTWTGMRGLLRRPAEGTVRTSHTNLALLQVCLSATRERGSSILSHYRRDTDILKSVIFTDGASFRSLSTLGFWQSNGGLLKQELRPLDAFLRRALFCPLPCDLIDHAQHSMSASWTKMSQYFLERGGERRDRGTTKPRPDTTAASDKLNQRTIQLVKSAVEDGDGRRAGGQGQQRKWPLRQTSRETGPNSTLSP